MQRRTVGASGLTVSALGLGTMNWGQEVSEEAAREIERQREQLRVTLTSIGDAAIVTDTQGVVTFLNPVAARLTGWPAQEAAGQPLERVFRIINEQSKAVMKEVLKDIQTGEYAKQFILENRAGAPTLSAKRRIMAEQQIEVVGEKLRAMMPWIKANKLVDRSRN